MSQVVKLPWVQEVGESFIPVRVRDFEEMRAYAMRIHDAYLEMFEENVRLNNLVKSMERKSK